MLLVKFPSKKTFKTVKAKENKRLFCLSQKGAYPKKVLINLILLSHLKNLKAQQLERFYKF